MLWGVLYSIQMREYMAFNENLRSSENGKSGFQTTFALTAIERSTNTLFHLKQDSFFQHVIFFLGFFFKQKRSAIVDNISYIYMKICARLNFYAVSL